MYNRIVNRIKPYIIKFDLKYWVSFFSQLKIGGAYRFDSRESVASPHLYM